MPASPNTRDFFKKLQIAGQWKGDDPQSHPLTLGTEYTLNQVRMFARLLCLSRLPSPGRGPRSPPCAAPSELAAAGELFPSIPPSFTQDVHIRTSASAGFHGRSLLSWGEPSPKSYMRRVQETF